MSTYAHKGLETLLGNDETIELEDYLNGLSPYISLLSFKYIVHVREHRLSQRYWLLTVPQIPRNPQQ